MALERWLLGEGMREVEEQSWPEEEGLCSAYDSSCFIDCCCELHRESRGSTR